MKKYIIGSILVLAVIAGTFLAVHSSTQDDNHKKPASVNTVDYSGPTSQEKAAGDEQKKQVVQDDEKDKNTPPKSSSNVPVFVTFAGQEDDTVEVNAYTSHYEDGTCTINFTQGSLKVSRNTPAYRDASTTVCTNPLIKTTDFPTGGKWSAQVIYTSTSGSFSGQSTPQTVTISL